MYKQVGANIGEKTISIHKMKGIFFNSFLLLKFPTLAEEFPEDAINTLDNDVDDTKTQRE